MAWRKKSNKNAQIVQMSEESVQEMEDHVAELVKSQLPLGRVKKVIRLNPDIEVLNNESLQLMAKAAELFIKELSNAANQNAVLEKRKTIQPKDIDRAIKKLWEFAFLEDALDGWPKIEPKKRNPIHETIVEGMNQDDEHDDNDTEEPEEAENPEDEELPETVPQIEDTEENDGQSIRDTFAEQF